MIAVGGLTRLTDFGLSITEWKPVTGALPPMDEATGPRSSTSIRRARNTSCRTRAMSLEAFKIDLLVGMGAPAAWPGDRAGLGGGVRGLSRCARRSPRAGPGGCCCWARWAGCRGRSGGGWCRRVWRGPAGCGLVPAGDASGAGLRDPGRHRVVCVPAGAKRGGADDGAARARGASCSACRPG